MEKRLSRFGVGPRIALPAIACAALAGVATHVWPDACLLRAVPYPFLWIPGALLALAGIALWLYSAVAVMRAYNRDQLVTSGAFGLCRHPLYAAWIVLILPGLALLTRSWPVMIAPLVAHLIFKRKIRVEDDYLRERFGSAYLEYRTRVRELLPIPRF